MINYNTDAHTFQARGEIQIKCANYIKNIKRAISNIFGKVFLGEIPGQKVSSEEIAN